MPLNAGDKIREIGLVAAGTGAGLAAHLVRQGVKLPHTRIERKPVSKRPFEQEMEIDRVEPRTIVGIPGSVAEAPTVPSFRAEVEIEMQVKRLV